MPSDLQVRFDKLEATLAELDRRASVILTRLQLSSGHVREFEEQYGLLKDRNRSVLRERV